MNPKDRKDTSFLNFSSWTFGRRFCSNQRPCPWWVWEWMILFSALFSSKLLLVRGGKNYIDIRNFIQSRHDYSSFIHGIFNSWPWKILPLTHRQIFFDPTDPMEKRENVCQLCWNVERTWDANIPNLNGHSDIPWQFPSGVDLMDIGHDDSQLENLRVG